MGELKVFSPKEVSSHSTREDCWLMIGGKVYDVTKFLHDHPGGDDVLVAASANGDATAEFEEVGHGPTAIGMMTSYLIGYLEGSNFNTVSEVHQISNSKAPSGGGSFNATITHETIALETRASTPTFKLLDIFVYLLVAGVAFGLLYVYKKDKILL